VALLHRATLAPTKTELLEGWIPSRRWARGAGQDPLTTLGSYRFDDPQGEVGMEVILVAGADGTVRQAPLTYRGAPQPELEAALVGTTEHSVLGRRWVYDGCADVVFVRALATAILTGGRQAELQVATDEGPVTRAPDTMVTGTGDGHVGVPEIGQARPVDGETTTVIDAGPVELTIARVLPFPAPAQGPGDERLLATWPGQDVETLVAWACLGAT
jgi:hypothetical protein